jgi:hypothetical protein
MYDIHFKHGINISNTLFFEKLSILEMDRRIPGRAVFCGPARDVAPYIEGIRKNIERLGPSFDDYAIIIVESDSADNTLEKL